MLKAKSLVVASFIAAVFFAGEAVAELKIGYVNTQRIFRDAPAAQKAGKKLEGEFGKRDQDLQRMAKQLKDLQVPTTKAHWKDERTQGTAWWLIEGLCRLSCSAHNNFHERFWLWKERGLQLPNLVWDTMLMHHALDPTAEHRLDYCASVDTREPFWKHEAKDPEDQRSTPAIWRRSTPTTAKTAVCSESCWSCTTTGWLHKPATRQRGLSTG